MCGVCEDDFNLNGLNTALEKGIVSDVVAYVAGNDSVIRWASTWVGRMLDYGDMGLYGATNVNAAVSGRVRVVDTGSWEDYGHSTCWSDDEFCGTMATILA